MDQADPLGLYVHIPFCRHLCPYCDFAVVPSSKSEDHRLYTEALVREIKFCEELGWKKGRIVRTLFFGGGTPSLLALPLLEKILNQISNYYPLDSEMEITLEMNPENVTTENAQEWKKLGFNRASIGIQSMQPHELSRLERTHDVTTARKSVSILREAGWKNISIDLMFGLEHQTIDGWKRTLDEVVSLRPDHISAYNLTIESKTRFAFELKKEQLTLPSDDAQAEMLLWTRNYLRSLEYEPYEISNFSKPQFESKHNQGYWLGLPYLGIGISAHSFHKIPGGYKRRWNNRSVKLYQEALLSGKLPPADSEELSPLTHLGERLMTGLRMTRGVSIKELEDHVGARLPDPISQKVQNELSAGNLCQAGDRIQLTEQGILISDTIFLNLLPYDR